MLDNLDVRLEQAQKGKWSYSDFLLTLLQDEIERREQKALMLRLKKSDLDSQKTLGTFDFSFNTRIQELTLKEIVTCNFIEKRENIFLLGPSGVGKSHLAQAIGHEACMKGHKVLFRRTFPLLGWLNGGRGDGTFERRMRLIEKAPLLILDDFGLNDLSKTQQEDLYEIICRRYERASMIITSNRDMSEWQTIFTNQLIASAALDRLVHGTIKIVIKGKSFRVDDFMSKNKGKDVDK